MGKAGKYAVGAAAAAVAGYVAGVLTAPKSGKETRDDIKKKAFKTKREAEQKLKALHADLDKTLGDARELGAKLSAKAKEEMATAMTAAMTAKDKVRQILSAIHEGDADDKDLDTAIKEAGKAVEHLKSYLRKNVQA